MTEQPISFCVDFARAVRLGDKTISYKPMSLASRSTFKCPYGESGDLLWVIEPWGRARGRIVYLADHLHNGRQTFPVGFSGEIVPLPREHARLFLDVRSIGVTQLHNINEDEAKLASIRPSQGRTTYLNEYKTHWDRTYHSTKRWAFNPLCWRISFTLRNF